jgi:hypothetical protein
MLVGLWTRLPVGSRILGPVEFSLRIVGITKVRQRALLVVHQCDEVGRVRECLSLQDVEDVEDVFEALVEKVPRVEAGDDFPPVRGGVSTPIWRF